MTTDIHEAAARLAEHLTDTCDVERIGYLQVLDALASAGLTLATDEEKAASAAYIKAVDLESLVQS